MSGIVYRAVVFRSLYSDNKGTICLRMVSSLALSQCQPLQISTTPVYNQR